MIRMMMIKYRLQKINSFVFTHISTWSAIKNGRERAKSFNFAMKVLPERIGQKRKGVAPPISVCMHKTLLLCFQP